MLSWIPNIAHIPFANFTLREHLKYTVPLCIWELFCIYLGTGYFIRIEIAHDPDHILNISEWIFWLVGSELAEL